MALCKTIRVGDVLTFDFTGVETKSVEMVLLFASFDKARLVIRADKNIPIACIKHDETTLTSSQDGKTTKEA